MISTSYAFILNSISYYFSIWVILIVRADIEQAYAFPARDDQLKKFLPNG